MTIKRSNRNSREMKIEAKSVSITADSISEPRKMRMSEVHHGSRSVAKGDVEIKIKTQYPNAGGREERPPAGAVIKTDKATIQARQILHRGRKAGRDRASADGNVGIFGLFRRSRRCPNHRIAHYHPA